MAVNIFDKYGIKEVANVYFEALEDDEKANVYKGDIVLFLDTLKVSTVETTAENVAAQGGWGNPRLVQWDYGKEINITLEDALISLESLRFMLGGAIKDSKRLEQDEKMYVRHTEEVVLTTNGALPRIKDHLTDTVMHPIARPDHPIRIINLGGGTGSESAGARTQIKVDSGTQEIGPGQIIKFHNPNILGAEDKAGVAGDRVRIFWDEEVTSSSGETAVEVTISPDTFPGTYKIVGDTFMRSEKTGKDEPFQFIINKAKVQSNVTITLQAEGDPSTFEMTLNVLRSNDEMMKLVRYNVGDNVSGASGDDFGSLSGDITAGESSGSQGG